MSVAAYFDHHDTEDARAASRRVFVATMLTTFVLAFAAALLVFLPNSPDAGLSISERAQSLQQAPLLDQAALAATKSDIEAP
jgi:hypothetical protein